MKPTLTNLLFILFLSLTCFSQEQTLKEYSYSEFFKMIEDEQDSIFSLENAVIKQNIETDSIHSYEEKYISSDSSHYEYSRTKFIDIHKVIKLNNVHFVTFREDSDILYGLHHVRFHKELEIKNILNGSFSECVFNKKVKIDENQNLIKDELLNGNNHNSMVVFHHCSFNEGVQAEAMAYHNSIFEKLNVQILFSNCNIKPLAENKNYHSIFFASNVIQLGLEKCHFYGKGYVSIRFNLGIALWINENSFPEQLVDLSIDENDDTVMLNVAGNTFNYPLLSQIDFNAKNLIFDWEQMKSGMLNSFSYSFNQSFDPDNYWKSHQDINTINDYLNITRIENERAFREEAKMLGQLYAKYKREHDIVNANKSYIYLKDLETQRLAYVQKTEPSFTNYFTWKINQFLKVFSAYGTQPAKAIIFSLYVILAFALIYLFFPNSWDNHGRKRIMDRYAFFLKYMKKDAGIHEVYLEEKQPELMEYETFRALVTNSNEHVPKFFIATGLPLYKWAVSGTKLHAAFLSKVDIMKGTWQNLPAHKRFWKSVLLVGAFLIAVIYDLIIKVLNALMLSINTFTTLGFGEIPIKGLPRYLAIIQGFIGWFMLTIFSVSLISQLLN